MRGWGRRREVGVDDIKWRGWRMRRGGVEGEEVGKVGRVERGVLCGAGCAFGDSGGEKI